VCARPWPLRPPQRPPPSPSCRYPWSSPTAAPGVGIVPSAAPLHPVRARDPALDSMSRTQRRAVLRARGILPSGPPSSRGAARAPPRPGTTPVVVDSSTLAGASGGLHVLLVPVSYSARPILSMTALSALGLRVLVDSSDESGYIGSESVSCVSIRKVSDGWRVGCTVTGLSICLASYNAASDWAHLDWVSGSSVAPWTPADDRLLSEHTVIRGELRWALRASSTRAGWSSLWARGRTRSQILARARPTGTPPGVWPPQPTPRSRSPTSSRRSCSRPPACARLRASGSPT